MPAERSAPRPRSTRRRPTAWAALLLLLLGLALAPLPAAWARAGGGGGFDGGGGGGGGGGGFGSGSDGFSFGTDSSSRDARPADLLFVLVLFAFVGLIAVVKMYQEKRRHLAPTRSLTNQLDLSKRMVAELEKRDPSFHLEDFLKKARTAFLAIQQAWSKQDLAPVRRFISDGVYQRFKTQIQMMKLLDQVNLLSDIKILGCAVAGAQSQGEYDVLQVWIETRLHDEYRVASTQQLQRGGEERFIEYWSFVRRRRAKKRGDLYGGEACPSCAAPLAALGDLARCGHCGSTVNTGEFDWVLSEITQCADWNPTVDQQADKDLTLVSMDDREFCRQVFEDRVSNAFMQIMGSIAARRPELCQRFLAEDVEAEVAARCAKLKSQGRLETYEALFINAVDFLAVDANEQRQSITVRVRFSSLKVMLDEKSRAVADRQQMLSVRSHYYRFERRAGVRTGPSNGAVALQCPRCAALLKVDQPPLCSTCGAVLTSGEHDWVIAGIDTRPPQATLDLSNAAVTQAAGGADDVYGLEPGDGRKLPAFLLRDVCVMVCADGEVHAQEEAFVYRLGKRLGLKRAMIGHWLTMARHRRLGFVTPSDPQMQKQVLALLLQAANSDGVIQAQERELLDRTSREMVQTGAPDGQEAPAQRRV